MTKKYVQLVFKRSHEQGEFPPASDFTDGEIIINTMDDLIFSKNSVSGEVTALNFPREEFETILTTLADSKVDRMPGKGLSSNDFTSFLREKLIGIEDDAQVNLPSTDARNSTSVTCVLQATAMNSHVESADHDNRYYTREELEHLINRILVDGRDFFAPTDLGIDGTGDAISITSSTGSSVEIPISSEETAGFVSIEQKEKLDSIEKGAEVNHPVSDQKDVTDPQFVLLASAMKEHVDSDDHDDLYYTRDEVNAMLDSTITVIRIPTIQSPAYNDFNVSLRPLLKANNYSHIYNVERAFRRYQVDFAVGDFSEPLYEATVASDTHLVPFEMPNGAQLKWRCRDEATDGSVSGWSEIAIFNLIDNSPASPNFIVEGAPDGLPEDPTLAASNFTGSNHAYTDWMIMDESESAEIWSSTGSSSLYNITVPKGYLVEGVTYTLMARFADDAYGEGKWTKVVASARPSFNTLAPTVTSPTDGANGYTAAYVATTAEEEDDLQEVEWIVGEALDFLAPIVAVVSTDPNLMLSFDPEIDYAVHHSKTLYIRMRHKMRDMWSDWSSVVSYATPTIGVAVPILDVEGASENVIMETPVLSGSPFSVNNAEDTHESSDWRVLDPNNSVIWQSLGDTVNLEEITVPAGQLNPNTTYRFQVSYNGSTYGGSGWAEKTGTTNDTFVLLPAAGEPLGGGFYAGGTIAVNGTEYAVIVAPRAQGGVTSSRVQWRVNHFSTAGTDSENDGAANTIAALASIESHPAAIFCDSLTINGFDDWHLPSKDELEICYRYLKPSLNQNDTDSGSNANAIPPTFNYSLENPAQTTNLDFRVGGTESFKIQDEDVNTYWSSTELEITYAHDIDFLTGKRSEDTIKTENRWARAVRLVAVRDAEDQTPISGPALTVEGAPDAVVLQPQLSGGTFGSLGMPGSHNSTHWQIIDNSTGNEIWNHITLDQGEFTTIQTPLDTIIPGTEYEFRVRYETKDGNDVFWSNWGSVTASTPDTSTNTPTLAISGAPDSLAVQPSLTTNAFSSEGWALEHYMTEYRILDDQDAEIWSDRVTDSRKTSMVLPLSVLSSGKTYTFSAVHIGRVQTGSSTYTEFYSPAVTVVASTPATTITAPTVSVEGSPDAVPVQPILNVTEMAFDGWDLDPYRIEWKIVRVGETVPIYTFPALFFGSTAHQIPADILQPNESYTFSAQYEGRVRTGGTDSNPTYTTFYSEWADTEASTPATFVVAPTLTVEGHPDPIGETPTLTVTEFAFEGWDMEYVSNQWKVVEDGSGMVVWESENTTVEAQIPSGILDTSKTYTISVSQSGRVRTGGSNQDPIYTNYQSTWVEVQATTRAVF